jgi:hypothetical protein
MRIDPKINGQLDRLGGGASDAAGGQRAAEAGGKAQDESAFEPLDVLLKNRLTVASMQAAASSVTSASDAQALAERTAELMRGNADAARVAQQGELLRGRLNDLLGD